MIDLWNKNSLWNSWNTWAQMLVTFQQASRRILQQKFGDFQNGDFLSLPRKNYEEIINFRDAIRGSR